MDYRKIKGVKHYVFDDIRDFNSFFTDEDNRPNVCFDWRTSNEGEWVLADDGGVIQLLKRDKTTKKEKVFATNIAVGMGAVKSYMDAFIELDSYKAGKKAAILLRQERVMKEVEQSVVDVAKTMGVDHEYVLVTLKTLVDSSQEDNIVLNAVKEIGKAIGTIGGITVKQRDTGIIGLFQGFEPEQLERAKRPEIEESNDITEDNEKKGE